MIPTVIVVGALFRRWWVVAVAAILWPISVVVWGDVDDLGGFLAAGVLGAVNAAFGAAIGTAVWNVILTVGKVFRRQPRVEAGR